MSSVDAAPASSILDAALEYLALGYHPIPVAPRGKRATVAWKTFQDTAPTEAQVREWFSRPANVALVMGRGVFAVDIDSADAAVALRDRAGDLPDLAPRNRTAKGCHVILEAPGAVADRVGVLPGVDIRGVGYIVVPPSVHPTGHVYSWEVRPGPVEDLPVAPASLLALLQDPRTPAATAPSCPPDAAPRPSTPPGAPKWVSEALAGVGEGQRDATCARLAGYFLSRGLPTDVVTATLDAWAARCRPPFPAVEVRKTVVSVARREAAKPTLAEDGTVPDIPASRPFQVLGHNRGEYFYLPRGSRQVVALSPRAHVKLALLELGPAAWWEAQYQGPQGVNWTAAANHLMRLAQSAGVYDPLAARGRGAWWDEDHAVLHLGDRLVVGGTERPLDAGRGKYVYEAAAPMSLPIGSPLPPTDAARLVDFLDLLAWEHGISSRLLAGWCVVAPICGALEWRPHVWVTGPAGSGKTWVIDNVVRRLVGDVGLAVQSETTEAGLRQTLGHDARPVIFDEAEGENERAQMRMQNILALCRQASSETGASIIKGSATGAARSYRIRSCFAFSSIGVGVQQHADETRVSVLSLRRDDDPERFPRVVSSYGTLVTSEWCARFLARAVANIPTIRANARTFATAGAAVLGSRRGGDQVGALLAGAYSLFSDQAITTDAAAEWVAAQDWAEQRAVGENGDELLCLQRILESVVPVRTARWGGDRSVAELLALAGGRPDVLETPLAPREAAAALARIGVRYDEADDSFVVANNHSGVADILRGTPWARGWYRILRRVPGATVPTTPVRFAGIKTRGVAFPMEII